MTYSSEIRSIIPVDIVPSENKLLIKPSSHSIIEVVAKKIRPFEEKETKISEHKTTVILFVADKNGELYKATVKVSDIAKLMNISGEKIKEYENAGALERTILEKMFQINPTDFGLSAKELKELQNFYGDNKDTFKENFKEPIYLNKKFTSLPRSTVYIPGKGLYVLLKTKGGMKEVGLGSYNLATHALHLDTGERKVFRTGRKVDVRPSELEANKILADLTDFCVVGIPVLYRGDMRPRLSNEVATPTRRDKPKKELAKLRQQAKVGLMMDEMRGGELYSKLSTLTEEECKKICVHIAKGYAAMHQRGIVHYDCKPENIFMDGDIPKIADFGFAKKMGEKTFLCGTPGYIAPELRSGVEVDPAHDIWSLGCLLADILNVPFADIIADLDKQYHFENYFLALPASYPQEAERFLEQLKDMHLGDKRRDPKHPFHIIDRCLSLGSRPSAEEVAKALEQCLETPQWSAS